MSNLGYMLQDKRRQLTMTVESVAKETSLSIGSIRGYEQGRRIPSSTSFKRLLVCLGLEQKGSWITSNAWKSNDGSIYNLAPFSGGHKRQGEDTIVITTVVEDLRLQVIQQVLKADPEILNIINSLFLLKKVS